MIKYKVKVSPSWSIRPEELGLDPEAPRTPESIARYKVLAAKFMKDNGLPKDIILETKAKDDFDLERKICDEIEKVGGGFPYGGYAWDILEEEKLIEDTGKKQGRDISI